MGFILTRSERCVDSEGLTQRKKFIHGFLATGGTLCHEANMEIWGQHGEASGSIRWQRDRGDSVTKWFMGRIRKLHRCRVANLGSIIVAGPLK